MTRGRRRTGGVERRYVDGKTGKDALAELITLQEKDAEWISRHAARHRRNHAGRTLVDLEPARGIEPRTFRLQGECSAD